MLTIQLNNKQPELTLNNLKLKSSEILALMEYVGGSRCGGDLITILQENLSKEAFDKIKTKYIESMLQNNINFKVDYLKQRLDLATKPIMTNIQDSKESPE